MARYGPLGSAQILGWNTDRAVNQTMNLTTQLNSGIRYIDIRCRHYNNSFQMHHGPIFQRAGFGSGVLDPIRTFLRNNPNETILMRVQEEHEPQGNTRSFGATFAEYHSRYSDIFGNPTSNNPTLGEVRGRIILLQQFSGSLFGINYGSLDIQDQWNIASGLFPGNIYNKWIAIRNHFNRTMNDSNRSSANSRIYLNHLSANTSSIRPPLVTDWWPYPWFVASGYQRRFNNSSEEVATSLQSQAYNWPDYIRARSIVGLRLTLFCRNK
ncbi:hypothetical protein IGM_02197 [Bacillus cereus HuB4-4]|uniref:1-phosphatidylinositol phosphodiesterase n=2 Tax=Bacillus cereus TaxID=1396 RepID=A0A9W5QWA2_BACCE|nr:hypothetical protein IGM_02197 [Bacillus cereus HuB4-4]